MRPWVAVFVGMWFLGLAAAARAEDAPSKDANEPAEKPAAAEASDWVARLVEKARPSVVVITVTGRDGTSEGIGTGFIISPDGLIATNLHVIGEARPIEVRSADGKTYEVTTVEAVERSVDLAILRVKAKNLPALKLGDSEKVKQGQPVVALGNPHGLEHSVVSGVISGSRVIDGLPLLQLAIPIEPGNSGGPLLDERGQVLGLLTMKSAVTANLGFAVKINALKPLVEKPNPVPIARWLTIGALDPDQWQTTSGARWRQHAGRMSVLGTGSGFGGRSLCLSKTKVPDAPYELAVTVKLDDDAGAAGLVFAADGEDRHYGFYPSNGHLRLSRFDGPDVFQWQVIREQASPHFKPGDWNTLRVRVEKDRIRCWVNEHSVIEEAVEELPTGSVGLAKFRTTEAEFKNFRIGKQLASESPAPEVIERIRRAIAGTATTPDAESRLVDTLAGDDAAASLTALDEQAKQLAKQTKMLERVAALVHHRDTVKRLADALKPSDEKIDLVLAALLIARLDNAELDVAAYEAEVSRLAKEIKRSLGKGASPQQRLAALDRYLFIENGFHGSRGDYYNRSNSYLNEVLDDREGLPITLAVLYMELARRLGVKVEGVALPGHFIVRSELPGEEPRLIDVYDGAKPMSRDEATQKAIGITGAPPSDEQLQPVQKQAIVERMLHNLLGVANREHDTAAMLRYVDAIVTVSPTSAQDRLMRAVLLYGAGRPAEAKRDTAWLLENDPPEIDPDKVRELHGVLERAESEQQ